jgi:hypothetical protein
MSSPICNSKEPGFLALSEVITTGTILSMVWTKQMDFKKKEFLIKKGSRLLHHTETV